MAPPDKTHVIDLASPAFIRARYVRRIQDTGGFTVTTDCARARRFELTEATKAIRTLHAAIAAGGFTPCVVPGAAVDSPASGVAP